jgi:predicted outer membrane repeat protein
MTKNSLLVLLLLTGCGGDDGSDPTTTTISECIPSIPSDEVCNGIDDDCDGFIDTNPVDGFVFYEDVDADGFGDPDSTISSCDDAVKGYVLDEKTDCDDTVATTHPGADEYCDGTDNDCDNETDEDDAVDAPSWYVDNDKDGFGDATQSLVTCYESTGFVADNTDCDDNIGNVYPGADEYCDGIDTDCDGIYDNDDAIGAPTWYADSDGDNFGDDATSSVACYESKGWVSDNSDCNDEDAATYPDAREYCDGIDNDCNGVLDDDYAMDTTNYYADIDYDGFGDEDNSYNTCSIPTGYVEDNTDCDDNSNTTYPGAPEFCDGVDTDCNWTLDDDYSLDALTWYADLDNDTYGDATNSTPSCSQPAGWVSDASDCDDSNSNTNPGAQEWCDNVDNDCNSTIDDDYANDVSDWHADTDGDNYGDATDKLSSCNAPSGYVSDDTDCDDSNNNTNPGAQEWCNGVDNDCNGTIDDDYANDANTYYIDADNDGYGNVGSFESACSAPTGYVALGSDCDDSDAHTNPSAIEYCDGIDSDCDTVEVSSGVGLTLDGGTSWSDESSYFSTTAGVQSVGSSAEGDWFFCGDTTYYVNWEINHDVTVTGINGRPTLHGGDLARVIDVNTNTVSITNINIENGYSPNDGGGIRQTDGTLNLVDVDLKFNYSEGNGGAIYLGSGAMMSADNIYLYRNASDQFGGGIYAIDGGEVVIVNSLFEYNQSKLHGGAIRASQNYNITLIDTAFYANLADSDDDGSGAGAAIALTNGSALRASNSGMGAYGCEFISNTDYSILGAAVHLSDSTADFVDCDFGEDLSANDNLPSDIASHETEFNYEYSKSATMACDGDGCGSVISEDTGMDVLEFNAELMGEHYIIGHVIEANDTRTIDSFELYTRTDVPCNPTYFVYESEDGSVWSERWSGVGGLTASAGLHSSGNIGIPTKHKHFYALFADYDTDVCRHVEYLISDKYPPTNISFGNFVSPIQQEWIPGDPIKMMGPDWTFWGNVHSTH